MKARRKEKAELRNRQKKKREYIRNSDAALLVVEHDISRAKSMADRLLVIDDGRVNPFISEVTAIEVKI